MEEKISKTKLKQKLKSKFRELCETWIIKAIEKHDLRILYYFMQNILMSLRNILIQKE